MPTVTQPHAGAVSSGPVKGDTFQANFVPVCYSRMPDDLLSGFSLHMRNLNARGKAAFTLYAGAEVEFTAAHRQRLIELGASFLYIPAEDQPKLRRKLEGLVEIIAANRSLELQARCEIVYETAVELLDEGIAERKLTDAVPRMRRIAAAIIMLHLESGEAFGHFFDAARHDACPTTHAANAAVWLPALAMATGEKQEPVLASMCLGALLYDFGMAFLPPAIRNHQGKFNANERMTLQQHPEIGAQLLRQVAGIEPVVSQMALQHHERLDGSGYPRGLTFDRIHPAARLLAVIDTYDALTSFRPFRNAGIAPPAALDVLASEAKNRYDAKIVEAWGKLLQEACPAAGKKEEGAAASKAKHDAEGRRRHERYEIKCSATLEFLELVAGIWTPRDSNEAVAHNLSRGGLGLLCRKKLNPGEYFRAKLRRKDGAEQILNVMVVRGREHGDGWFEAGTRFVDLEQEAGQKPVGTPNV